MVSKVTSLDVRWVGPSRPHTKHWADISWPVVFCSKTPKQMGGFTWTLKKVSSNKTWLLFCFFIQEIPTQRIPFKRHIFSPHQKKRWVWVWSKVIIVIINSSQKKAASWPVILEVVTVGTRDSHKPMLVTWVHVRKGLNRSEKNPEVQIYPL